MLKPALEDVEMAKQGHRYTYHQKDAIAMESGWFVRIMIFDPERPWISYTTHARASKLIAQPMKYFGGQIPS